MNTHGDDKLTPMFLKYPTLDGHYCCNGPILNNDSFLQYEHQKTTKLQNIFSITISFPFNSLNIYDVTIHPLLLSIQRNAPDSYR